MINFFFLFLTAILISEGFAIPDGREISMYFLYTFPFIMLLYVITVKSRIVVPKLFSIIYCVFILFSFVSTYGAADVSVGFQFTLIYISLFFIFLITYNLKKELLKHINRYVFFFTIVTLLYSFFITFFTPESWVEVLSNRTYQFVYPSFHTQHPLGRWLIIPSIYSFSLYYFSFQKKYLYLFVFFTSILCLTYVRAGYVALLVTMSLIIYVKYKNGYRIFNKKIVSVIIGVMLLVSILLFATVQEAKQIPILKSLHYQLEEHASLPYKTLLGARPEFYNNAIEAIKAKPLFGYGPNNLIYAAREQSPSGLVAYTSENIFLEVFAENGIIGGVLFLMLMFLIVKSSLVSLRKLDISIAPLIFVFIGLLTMFQIDSSARFYSFLTTLFLFGGLIYKEKEYQISIKYLVIPAMILFLLAQLMIFNQIFTMQNRHQLAYKIYPLNKENYYYLIQEKINSQLYTDAEILLRKYEFLYKGNTEALYEIDRFYTQLQLKK